MICPTCKADGRKSSVSARALPICIPAGFVANQYDEEGRQIMPRPARQDYECSCSNGHRWATGTL